MPFRVTLTPSAEVDLEYFKRFEQRVIVDAAKRYLQNDAQVESPHRKSCARIPWPLGNCGSGSTGCFMRWKM